jgi:hypothetical protein
MGKPKIQRFNLSKWADFNEVDAQDIDKLLQCRADELCLSVDELKQPGLIKTNGDGEEGNNDEEKTICELQKHNFRSN